MQLPEWTRPALMGAGVGAVAAAVIGFSWGGWVTGGSATKLADRQSTAAVAAALTPYCVLRSQSDPDREAVIAELDTASNYQRRGIIEDAGWATPLGSDEPNRDLAQACQIALAENN